MKLLVGIILWWVVNILLTRCIPISVQTTHLFRLQSTGWLCFPPSVYIDDLHNGVPDKIITYDSLLS